MLRVFCSRVPPPTLSLSTRLRPPHKLGPDRIIRLGSEAGFNSLAVEPSEGEPASTRELVRVVATAGLKAGLPVAIAPVIIAEDPLGKDKRLPHLGAWPSSGRSPGCG